MRSYQSLTTFSVLMLLYTCDTCVDIRVISDRTRTENSIFRAKKISDEQSGFSVESLRNDAIQR